LNFIPNNSGNIPSNSVKTSLDATAKIKAEEVFDKYFTKCGDYHFTITFFENFEKETLQFDNVTAAIDSDREFSDADRKNGLEWSGGVSFKSTSYRHMSETGSEPSKWVDIGESEIYLPDLHLEKYLNEEWKVSPVSFSLWSSLNSKAYKKPECSQIPQALLK
jgi:hypothetical protein